MAPRMRVYVGHGGRVAWQPASGPLVFLEKRVLRQSTSPAQGPTPLLRRAVLARAMPSHPIGRRKAKAQHPMLSQRCYRILTERRHILVLIRFACVVLLTGKPSHAASLLVRLWFGLILLVPSLAVAQTASLDIPGNGSTLSGIGVISGWKCEATGPITVRINGGSSIHMVYGSERGDTRGQCGDTDNGFLAIFNWALLGEGNHTAVAYDNGEEFARSTFEVGTLGEEFVRGRKPRCGWRIFHHPGRVRCWSGMRAANTSRSPRRARPASLR